MQPNPLRARPEQNVVALKDMLVYVDQTPSATARVRLAVDLAGRHGSRLTALFAKEWNQGQLHERKAAELGLASALQVQGIDRRVEAAIDRAGEQLRATLLQLGEQRGLTVGWRDVEGSPSVVVPQQARYADLCILGHDTAIPGHDTSDDSTSADYNFSEQVLFVTGRPVLFVPATGNFKTLGYHVAVAWDSSRAAARSLDDAMSLIERSERITVLAVNPADYPERRGAPSLEHIVADLGRHGVSVDVVQLENVPPHSIGDVLQAKAGEIGADLLVAGAFGHARLREKLLGGVTRDLLERMTMPLLMSH